MSGLQALNGPHDFDVLLFAVFVRGNVRSVYLVFALAFFFLPAPSSH